MSEKLLETIQEFLSLRSEGVAMFKFDATDIFTPYDYHPVIEALMIAWLDSDQVDFQYQNTMAQSSDTHVKDYNVKEVQAKITHYVREDLFSSGFIAMNMEDFTYLLNRLLKLLAV